MSAPNTPGTSPTENVARSLVNELSLSAGRYAVEVNGELVPKSQLDQTPIKEGMVIEVVQAVGGG